MNYNQNEHIIPKNDTHENIGKNQEIIYVDRLGYLCAFCNIYFSTSTVYGEHLLTCGNRTDQCPKCRKFIKRAMFAYHYENNCAILDEFNDSISTISTGFDFMSRASHVNDSVVFLPPSDIEDTRNEKHHDTLTFKPDQIHDDKHINHGLSRSVKCTFCGQNYHDNTLEKHQENCHQHLSKYTTSTEREQSIHNSNQNNNRSYQSNFNDRISCPYCNDNELFNEEELHDHVKTYHEQNQQPIFQRHIRRQCIISTVPCEHCEKQCPFNDVNIHQMYCDRNPRNIRYGDG